jgi:hypothetical protein
MERRAVTKVDVVNAAVVKRAEKLGALAMPNPAIAELGREFERGERRPSPDFLHRVPEPA